MHELFENDNDQNLQDIKRTIIKDLLFRLEMTKKKEKTSLSYFPEGNQILLESINHLFKSEPTMWQSTITKSCSFTKKLIKNIIQYQLPFTMQFIFIEFTRLNSNEKCPPIENFKSLVEFLRLHCEDHNKVYQTLFINSIVNDFIENNFTELILKISMAVPNHLIYFKYKKALLKNFKPATTPFFNDIIILLTDYLIEIIQFSFQQQRSAILIT